MSTRPTYDWPWLRPRPIQHCPACGRAVDNPRSCNWCGAALTKPSEKSEKHDETE